MLDYALHMHTKMYTHLKQAPSITYQLVYKLHVKTSTKGKLSHIQKHQQPHRLHNPHGATEYKCTGSIHDQLRGLHQMIRSTHNTGFHLSPPPVPSLSRWFSWLI